VRGDRGQHVAPYRIGSGQTVCPGLVPVRAASFLFSLRPCVSHPFDRERPQRAELSNPVE
jgi:hypothetical protein